MPYREIPNEDALPAPEPHNEKIAIGARTETCNEYLRLLSDRMMLQDQRTAQIYVRRDGLEWDCPAIRVWRQKDNSTRWERRPAWGDAESYGSHQSKPDAAKNKMRNHVTLTLLRSKT